MSILHMIWALLPLTFFMLAGWGLLRPYLGYYGKENIRHYVVQGTYCLLGLGIAIAIDTSEKFAGIVDALSWGMLDLSIARWLLYPAVLVVLASIQTVVKKENRKRTLPKPAY